MDNATGHERKMMVVIDICMGLSLLFWALAFKLVKYHYKNDKEPLSEEIEILEKILHLANYLNYIIAGSVIIILIV